MEMVVVHTWRTQRRQGLAQPAQAAAPGQAGPAPGAAPQQQPQGPQQAPPQIPPAPQPVQPQPPPAAAPQAPAAPAPQSQQPAQIPVPPRPPQAAAAGADTIAIDDGSFVIDDETKLFQPNMELTPTPASEADREWQGGWNIGNGRNPAAVWTQHDGSNKITDVVVVKDTYMRKDRAWIDPLKWDGDVRDPRKRRPMEFAVQHRLSKLQDRRYFAGVRKCKVFNRHRMYRLYLPLCVYGDSSALVTLFEQNGRQGSAAGRIPEPVLWHVFETLAEAAVVMEKGALDGRVQDWQQIVHRDLKVDNILLDEARPERYPSYPSLRISDYDNVLRTSKRDPCNPLSYLREVKDVTGAGHLWYQAPEGLLGVGLRGGTRVAFEGGKTYPILSPANVWAIGACMVDFIDGMYLKSLGEGVEDWADWDIHDFAKPNEEHDLLILTPEADHYSDELKKLVRDCGRFEPKQRPTPKELLERIRACVDEGVAANPNKYHRGLRTRAQPVTEIEEEWKLQLEISEYAKGLSRPNLPQGARV